jgi:hypothetical protein
MASEHSVAARRERQANAERQHQAEVVGRVVGRIEDHLVRKAPVDFRIGKLAHFELLAESLDFVFMICSIGWLWRSFNGVFPMFSAFLVVWAARRKVRHG